MPTTKHLALTSSAVMTAVVLAGCAGGDATPSEAPAELSVTEPVVVTYDGGLAVLNGETLEVANQIPMDGFLRINPAGDEDHVMVSTSEGFQVLDAARAQLTRFRGFCVGGHLDPWCLVRGRWTVASTGLGGLIRRGG